MAILSPSCLVIFFDQPVGKSITLKTTRSSSRNSLLCIPTSNSTPHRLHFTDPACFWWWVWSVRSGLLLKVTSPHYSITRMLFQFLRSSHAVIWSQVGQPAKNSRLMIPIIRQRDLFIHHPRLLWAVLCCMPGCAVPPFTRQPAGGYIQWTSNIARIYSVNKYHSQNIFSEHET